MQKKIFQDGHTEGVYVCVFGDMCVGGTDVGGKGFTLLLSTEGFLDSTGGWVVALRGGVLVLV